MDYPIIIDFDMGKARLLRATLYIGNITLALVIIWAIATGQGRLETVAGVIAMLLVLLLTMSIHHNMLKPRFRCQHALEIHANHLVWATADGPHIIPRHGALAVLGCDKLQWDGMVHGVELEVTPEYCVRPLYGTPQNPRLEQEFADGYTEVSVSIALENWLRDRP